MPSRLVSLRGSLGMTQRQLGSKIGRSHNTIMNWEKGNTPFPREMVSVFADLLNVNPSWLLSGEGPMLRREKKDTVEVEVLTLAGLGDLYDLQNHEPIEVKQLAKDLVINVGRETRTAIRCKGDSMSPTILNDALVRNRFQRP